MKWWCFCSHLWWWCVFDSEERLRVVEDELTCRVDELSNIIQQKVAFNDSRKLTFVTCFYFYRCTFISINIRITGMTSPRSEQIPYLSCYSGRLINRLFSLSTSWSILPNDRFSPDAAFPGCPTIYCTSL